MSEVKRLHYFTKQFLVEEDFTDEQAYHKDMRHRHNRYLHDWGIADGLDVSIDTSGGVNKAVVAPGLALDSDGNEIVVVNGTTYNTADIPALSAGDEAFVTVKYQDVSDEADLYTSASGQVQDYRRTTERPLVEVKDTAASDGSEIVLARLYLDTGALAIDTSGRRYTGGDLAPGSVTNAALADDAVTAVKILNGSVGTDELADNAVTAAKLQSHTTDDNSRAVTADHIKDGAVTAVKLQSHTTDDNSRAVTTDHIKDGAITESKLGDDVKKKLFDASRIHKVPLLQQTIFSPRIWEAAIDTGSFPYGLAFDGRNLWVSNNNPSSTSLTKIDVKSRTFTVVPVGITTAFGIAFDGSAYVWVADYNNGDVIKIDIDTHTPETVINVGSGFNPMGIACSGQHMWVANYSNNSVSKINIASGVKETDVTVGSFPYHLAFDGSHMWVPNYGSNTVSKIDVETNVKETDVAVGTSPVGIAFDGACMWVANKNSSTISKIDVNTNSKIIDVPVGINPWGVAFDGTHIWVANRGTINGGGYDSSISKIDITTNTVVLTLTGKDEPVSIAFDGDSLWVPDYGRNGVTSMKKVI